ncbi:MAG: hypothetical protein DYG94_00220 [Leptolyngbya sp. PLA3]|nr:MAG: hypothetical protein EDM82_01655 [Cyanobacteria bacterium CYA]MCE7967160.1 hypothetical protein [Leptolyngbya sp. PL-A3]
MSQIVELDIPLLRPLNEFGGRGVPDQDPTIRGFDDARDILSFSKKKYCLGHRMRKSEYGPRKVNFVRVPSAKFAGLCIGAGSARISPLHIAQVYSAAFKFEHCARLKINPNSEIAVSIFTRVGKVKNS